MAGNGNINLKAPDGSSSQERRDQSRLAVLKALHELELGGGSLRLQRGLAGAGVQLQPRTIRHYLRQLDAEGLTELVNRRHGRILTPKGLEELQRANVMDKIGFVASKVDTLGFQMSFNAALGAGSIITNVTLIRRLDLRRALAQMRPVFEKRLGMGSRLAVAWAGQALGRRAVPQGFVGLGTVCSVTLNGIMLKRGIPVASKFGGLLEMRGGCPRRFVELVDYGGTTIDPLEIFIKGGMTQVRACAQTGDGMVGASFREFPSIALEQVRQVQQEMESLGLGGILAIGMPNRPLLGIPVTEGRTGLVVIGGLNPVAAVHEAGIATQIQSLAGLHDFSHFNPHALAIARAAGPTGYTGE